MLRLGEDSTKSRETWRKKVTQHHLIVDPFLTLGYSSEPIVHLTAARNYMQNRIPGNPYRSAGALAIDMREFESPISRGDFRAHPVGYLVAELFELHDRSRFEVIGRIACS